MRAKQLLILQGRDLEMFDAMLILAAKTVFVLFVLFYLVYISLALYEIFLRGLKVFVSMPVGLRVILQRGETMANVLTYRVSVNAPVDGDVVSRELTVLVNGVELMVVHALGSATDLGSIDVPQDALVVLSLVDVDDAGNRSAPATVEFTAVDTLAPAQPGGFNVTLVSEKVVADAPVVETPVVDVPVVEESTPETDTTNG
jgi:hypothetical protein